jgi:DNA-binding transcriptional ArsR family regulator
MSLIQQLKALADENRLKILQMLLNGDLCVGALAQHLGISKPAVSQHLRVLREAGLVKGEKRGYWTHYVVEREAMRRVAERLQAMSANGRSSQTFCWRISDFPQENHQK